ncbi:hypothetical protein [uncultured Rubinisphaera sp.]|uniref:hypothetical protein n=1 Tax=uncultured Rubinisphaera sp. TaxID=1678686 RepID=UPI0030D9447D|tara:strand:- start:55 stop:651 length:597 start_codon:yes stop_codon:yes gene_type:complete
MVSIKHPLLHDLRQFDAEAAHRFPAKFDNGLGQMGMLIYSECRNEGYWCTPKNSMAFATTGGDGVHFSFIVENNKVTENSPVIVTVPANSGEPEIANLVVADNLRNYLRFGLHRGYFALEQLAYHRDLTLQAYSSSEWQPTEDWHCSVGYHLGDYGQRVRDFLVERFDLTPLPYTVTEFEVLQDKYKPLLKYPAENEW